MGCHDIRSRPVIRSWALVHVMTILAVVTQLPTADSFVIFTKSDQFLSDGRLDRICPPSETLASIYGSSPENAKIASDNYPWYTPDRWVATTFGDEFPELRNDLIRRKNNGENWFRRHYNAWTNPSNWKPSPRSFACV